MIEPREFIAALEKLDIRFVTGVPDSLLKDVCACITEYFHPPRHVIATNEGSAVGLAIGHYLATGRPALIYMQNSGIGNVVNPATSLADPQVYGIPMILMIGWRGEMQEDGTQLHDEPQHVKQGQVTLQQLAILDIPYRVVDGSVAKVEPLLDELIRLALSRSGPVSLVVRKKTFSTYKMMQREHEDHPLTREAAIAAIIAALPEHVPIVSTTGMASRELFELRKAANQGHHRDFLTVGGMGHAGQIAAGMAMARPDRQIVCIDGDGAVLMHMGGLTISADCRNLLHILINNGAHDSVGGQPTKGAMLDFTKIAKACGYGYVSCASTTEEITANLQAMLGTATSSFLEIKCRRGARVNLGRPDRTPAQNKRELLQFLEGFHE
jgi:phosphonopyruvate decarboxylase